MRQNATAPNADAQHFPGLDGLRGVAALVVVLLHGTLTFDVGYVPNAACLAVDFFFLLSGFVIAYAYDAKLRSHRMTWRWFMGVRLIRLYPMLFAGLAFGGTLFVLSQIHKHDVALPVACVVTLTSFALIPLGLLFGEDAYPPDIVAWSLYFELVVNSLYATRFGTLGNRTLALVVAGCGAALIPMALWGGPYIAIGYATPAKFLLGFVRVAYPFWAGVLLFRLAAHRLMPRLPIGIVAALLAVLLLAPIGTATNSLVPAYQLGAVLFVFPAIVAAAANAQVGAVGERVCSDFGRLSYPLYLIHYPIFRVVRRASEVMHFGRSPATLLIGSAVVAVVAAEVLLVAFDEPVRRWLRGHFPMHDRRVEFGSPA